MWLLLSEAMETIQGGGRWDESVWLAASLNDATDNDERGWVESLLASGRGQDMAPKWLGRHCAGLL
jgi:hypothetical protein